MSKRPVIPTLLSVLLLFLALAGSAWAQTPIVFELPWDHGPDEVYLQILGVDDNNVGIYYDSTGTQQTLATNTAYSMSTLTGTTAVATGVPSGVPAVLINVQLSGARFYINYGASGLTIPYADYTPNAAAEDSAADGNTENYKIRYQYFEPAIYPDAQDWFDLSYIDFVSIPLNIEVINGGTINNNPQTTSATGMALAKAASGASNPAGSNILPSGAKVTDADFTRVLGSNLASQAGETYYHDWSTYLSHLHSLFAGAGYTATLEDCYVGSGSQPSGDPTTQQQYYSYNVTFGSTSVILSANSGSGDASSVNVCVGDGNTGTGIGDQNTITIQYSDLNDPVNGVYSNNTGYSFTNSSGVGPASGSAPNITNDYWGKVVGDVLAGLSYGVFGSQTVYNGSEFPSYQGTKIGEFPSMYWWTGKNKTTYVAPADSLIANGYALNSIQSNSDYYDDYAASINGLTTAYGIPFGDRIGLNTITMNYPLEEGEYVLITVGQDTPPPGAATTELLLLDK